MDFPSSSGLAICSNHININQNQSMEVYRTSEARSEHKDFKNRKVVFNNNPSNHVSSDNHKTLLNLSCFLLHERETKIIQS